MNDTDLKYWYTKAQQRLEEIEALRIELDMSKRLEIRQGEILRDIVKIINGEPIQDVDECMEALQVELDKAVEARQEAQIQLEQYQKRQAESGLCIDAALRGEVRKGEDYWDGRMEAVRQLRVERDGLMAQLEWLRSAVNVSGVYKDSQEVCDALISIPTYSLAHIKAQGAREALQEAMQIRGFSGTVVSVADVREAIEQMEGGK